MGSPQDFEKLQQGMVATMEYSKTIMGEFKGFDGGVTRVLRGLSSAFDQRKKRENMRRSLNEVNMRRSLNELHRTAGILIKEHDRKND